MKKLFVFFITIFIACGPSEEEIQIMIDEAVEQATSTTTILTTTTTQVDSKIKCDIFLRSVKIIKEEIDAAIIQTLNSSSEGLDVLKEAYEMVESLKGLDEIILNIETSDSYEEYTRYVLLNFWKSSNLITEKYVYLLENGITSGPDLEEWTAEIKKFTELHSELENYIEKYTCNP